MLRSTQTMEESLVAGTIDELKFYTIECKQNGLMLRNEHQAFRMEEGDSLRVTGNKQAHNLINHLWMFKRIKDKFYEIVHCSTDLVITMEDYEARLEHGKQKSSQMFEIMTYRSGFMRIKDYMGGIVYLDGILQSSDYNEKDDSQMFKINGHGMFSLGELRETVFILDIEGKLSLDLVNAAREQETEIILYAKNFRMNQRWIIDFLEMEGEEDTRYKVYIRSALTDFYVIYNKEDNCLNQATYPEEWRIEEVARGTVRIEHVKQHKYLSKSENGDQLILSKRPTAWQIDNAHEGLYCRKVMKDQVII